MRLPENRHYRIASGTQHDILQAFTKETDDAYKALDEIGIRYGAEPKRFIMYGTRVIALYFKTPPADKKVWSRVKDHHGYYRPLRRTKEGKAISDALGKLLFPSSQDLAVRLGAKPFFHLNGQPYCATVGHCQKNGVYYIQAPFLSPINVTEGTTIIEEAVWAEETKDIQ